MAHDLPGLFARHTKSQSIRDIIETAFEQPQQRFAGDTGLPLCPLEHSAELPFLKAVDSSQFLFFAKLQAVVGGPLDRKSVV